jgi:hypothetical protein
LVTKLDTLEHLGVDCVGMHDCGFDTALIGLADFYASHAAIRNRRLALCKCHIDRRLYASYLPSRNDSWKPKTANLLEQ